MNGHDREHETEQVYGKQHESQYDRGQRKSPMGREEINNKKLGQRTKTKPWNRRLLGIKVGSIPLDEKALMN